MTLSNHFHSMPKSHTSFLASYTNAILPRVRCRPIYFEPPSLILGIHTNARANSHPQLSLSGLKPPPFPPANDGPVDGMTSDVK